MQQISTKSIGVQIARGRKEKLLSQQAFADLLAVTQQTVAKWEGGRSLPDIFMLAKIAFVIGKEDICYFLGKDEGCSECDCCKKD
ncbi:MAG: helix-turn-helix domain-containing protein [Firmicutes bacterium]|nr:helix-turn-helix domain-containing protein [Bacillota bacterium]